MIYIDNDFIEDFDILCEATDWRKILVDGEMRICHYPKFPIGHQDRPSIVVYKNGFGPYIMTSAHIEPGDNSWKKYPENVYVEDWKQEKFDRPSYMNTGVLYDPDEIKIYGHKSFLTKNDYDRIVQPVIDRLTANKLDELFESFDIDNIDILLCNIDID